MGLHNLDFFTHTSFVQYQTYRITHTSIESHIFKLHNEIVLKSLFPEGGKSKDIELIFRPVMQC